MAKHAAHASDPVEVEASIEPAPDGEAALERPSRADDAQRGTAPAGAPFGGADPEAYRSSRRTRRALKVVIAIIVVVIVAGIAAAAFFLATNGQQAGQTASERTAIASSGEAGANGPSESSTEVPVIATLLGSNVDAATAAVGHGATVTNTSAIDEEDNPIKSIVTLELSDEPTDSRTGTPSVYLSLDESGNAIEVAYAAGVSQLGYGSMSFVDAVESAHVVESTLAAAGISVPEGTATLPDDPAAYTTYDESGSIRTERYSFTGTANVDGTEISWTADLVYDYTSTAVSGSLSDTTRRITITMSQA